MRKNSPVHIRLALFETIKALMIDTKNSILLESQKENPDKIKIHGMQYAWREFKSLLKDIANDASNDLGEEIEDLDL